MSEPTTGAGGQMQTLAVRITKDLRAQLDVIAAITGRNATEEIRLAIENWIEKVKSDPATLQKAAAVRAEIERNAQTQRNAIASIFGGDGTTTGEAGGDSTAASTETGDTGATGEAETPAPSRPATRRGNKSDSE